MNPRVHDNKIAQFVRDIATFVYSTNPIMHPLLLAHQIHRPVAGIVASQVGDLVQRQVIVTD